MPDLSVPLQFQSVLGGDVPDGNNAFIERFNAAARRDSVGWQSALNELVGRPSPFRAYAEPPTDISASGAIRQKQSYVDWYNAQFAQLQQRNITERPGGSGSLYGTTNDILRALPTLDPTRSVYNQLGGGGRGRGDEVQSDQRWFSLPVAHQLGEFLGRNVEQFFRGDFASYLNPLTLARAGARYIGERMRAGERDGLSVANILRAAQAEQAGMSPNRDVSNTPPTLLQRFADFFRAYDAEAQAGMTQQGRLRTAATRRAGAEALNLTLQNWLPVEDANSPSGYRFDPVRGYFGEFGGGAIGAGLYALNAIGSAVPVIAYTVGDAIIEVADNATGGRATPFVNEAIANAAANTPAFLRDKEQTPIQPFQIRNDPGYDPFYRARQVLSGIDLGFTNVMGATNNRYLSFVLPEGYAMPARVASGALGFGLDVVTGGWSDSITGAAVGAMRRYAIASARTASREGLIQALNIPRVTRTSQALERLFEARRAANIRRGIVSFANNTEFPEIVSPAAPVPTPVPGAALSYTTAAQNYNQPAISPRTVLQTNQAVSTRQMATELLPDIPFETRFPGQRLLPPAAEPGSRAIVPTRVTSAQEVEIVARRFEEAQRGIVGSQSPNGIETIVLTDVAPRSSTAQNSIMLRPESRGELVRTRIYPRPVERRITRYVEDLWDGADGQAVIDAEIIRRPDGTERFAVRRPLLRANYGTIEDPWDSPAIQREFQTFEGQRRLTSGAPIPELPAEGQTGRTASGAIPTRGGPDATPPPPPITTNGEELRELFAEADRIGAKYQTPQEVQAFQRRYAQVVEDIGRILDDETFTETANAIRAQTDELVARGRNIPDAIASRVYDVPPGATTATLNGVEYDRVGSMWVRQAEPEAPRAPSVPVDDDYTDVAATLIGQEITRRARNIQSDGTRIGNIRARLREIGEVNYGKLPEGISDEINEILQSGSPDKLNALRSDAAAALRGQEPSDGVIRRIVEANPDNLREILGDIYAKTGKPRLLARRGSQATDVAADADRRTRIRASLRQADERLSDDVQKQLDDLAERLPNMTDEELNNLILPPVASVSRPNGLPQADALADATRHPLVEILEDAPTVPSARRTLVETVAAAVDDIPEVTAARALANEAPVRPAILDEAIDEGVLRELDDGLLVNVADEIAELESYIESQKRTLQDLTSRVYAARTAEKRKALWAQQQRIRNNIDDANFELRNLKRATPQEVAVINAAAPILTQESMRPAMKAAEYLNYIDSDEYVQRLGAVSAADILPVKRTGEDLSRLAKFLVDDNGKPLMNPARASVLNKRELDKLRNAYPGVFDVFGKPVPKDLLNPNARMEVQPRTVGTPQVTQFVAPRPTLMTEADANSVAELPPQVAKQELYREQLPLDKLRASAKRKEQLIEDILNDPDFNAAAVDELMEMENALSSFANAPDHPAVARSWNDTLAPNDIRVPPQDIEVTMEFRQAQEALNETGTGIREMAESIGAVTDELDKVAETLDLAPQFKRGRTSDSIATAVNYQAYDPDVPLPPSAQRLVDDAQMVELTPFNIDDRIARQAELDEFMPEPLDPVGARAANAEAWYHGTKQTQDAMFSNEFNPVRGGSSGEFGVGLYLTDRADVAEVYARAATDPTFRYPGTSRLGSPRVYRWSDVQPRSPLFLGQAPRDLPDDVGRVVNDAFGGDILDDILGATEEMRMKLRDLNRQHPLLRDRWLNVREAYAETFQTPMPEALFQDYAVAVSERLRNLGFDSLIDVHKTRGKTLLILPPATQVSFWADSPLPPGVPAQRLAASADEALDAVMNRHQADNLLHQAMGRRTTAAWEQESRMDTLENMLERYTQEYDKLVDEGLFHSHRAEELRDQLRELNRAHQARRAEAVQQSAEQAQVRAAKDTPLNDQSPCI
jgi:hypothetical protein